MAGSFPLFFSWSTGLPQMHLLRRTPEVLLIIHRGLDDLGQMLGFLLSV